MKIDMKKMITLGATRKVSVLNITNIDYAHFLSFHKGKCSRAHNHTSWNISAEAFGILYPNEDMLVDFGILKSYVKEVVNEIDHKFIVKEKFVTRKDDHYYEIEYTSQDGKYHRLTLPSDEVFILDKESTAENISGYIASKVLEKMEENVYAVGIVFSEGTNNVCEAIVTREDEI